METKEKKHTHTWGQSDFLGQNFGQTKRNHSALGKKLMYNDLIKENTSNGNGTHTESTTPQEQLIQMPNLCTIIR
jgi:hypothetical protein